MQYSTPIYSLLLFWDFWFDLIWFDLIWFDLIWKNSKTFTQLSQQTSKIILNYKNKTTPVSSLTSVPDPDVGNHWAWWTLSSLQDRSDWLMDSALGRWLNSRHGFMSNLTLLKVLLWLVLLGLFVELEFGLAFFVLSLFYWLYEGLRSPAAREPGEMSAYSVFNPDCEPLLGSLTAEQLEGEMGFIHLASIWSALHIYIK